MILAALFALVAASVAGAYLWYRHEDSVERTVHARLKPMGLHADWVSCSKDHTAPAGSTTVTYYRCDLHGEEAARRDGLVPLGSAVCIPFIGDHVVTEAEARRIWRRVPFEKTLCEGFS